MHWAGNAGMYFFLNTTGIDTSNLDSRNQLAPDALTKFYYFNDQFLKGFHCDGFY